jgi:hypothetical protein
MEKIITVYVFGSSWFKNKDFFKILKINSEINHFGKFWFFSKSHLNASPSAKTTFFCDVTKVEKFDETSRVEGGGLRHEAVDQNLPQKGNKVQLETFPNNKVYYLLFGWADMEMFFKYSILLLLFLSLN